jgi:hypothetical protein
VVLVSTSPYVLLILPSHNWNSDLRLP